MSGCVCECVCVCFSSAGLPLDHRENEFEPVRLMLFFYLSTIDLSSIDLSSIDRLSSPCSFLPLSCAVLLTSPVRMKGHGGNEKRQIVAKRVLIRKQVWRERERDRERERE